MSKPTFVVGDVHGHFDRLAALLQAAGILGDCPDCEGTGNISPSMAFTPAESITGPHFTFEAADTPCPTCDGDAIVRVRDDVTVIQLGDLGHFGGATGSPTGDHMCYEYADRWLDLILWGNHDRAVVDVQHAFNGFSRPQESTRQIINDLWEKGKIKLAAAAHGYLIVHGGVPLWHKTWIGERDASSIATWLNEMDEERLVDRKERGGQYLRKIAFIDDVGKSRTGSRYSPEVGGILWSDWDKEKHLDGKPFKYICGHTRQKEPNKDQWGNWCIDIGGVNNGRIAGVWLDEGRVIEKVQIDLSSKGQS